MASPYVNLLQGLNEMNAETKWASEFMPRMLRIMNASAKGIMRERAIKAKKAKPKRGKWKR